MCFSTEINILLFSIQILIQNIKLIKIYIYFIACVVIGIKDTRGRSRKKHEDPPKGMYEEVDDSGRGERGM